MWVTRRNKANMSGHENDQASHEIMSAHSLCHDVVSSALQQHYRTAMSARCQLRAGEIMENSVSRGAAVVTEL